MRCRSAGFGDAAPQTTDSDTFSVFRSLDAKIPASTEYCANRSAGRNDGSHQDELTINNQLSTKNYFSA
jgi:hypothetical protein